VQLAEGVGQPSRFFGRTLGENYVECVGGVATPASHGFEGHLRGDLGQRAPSVVGV
jgi:hypothetical protein